MAHKNLQLGHECKLRFVPLYLRFLRNQTFRFGFALVDYNERKYEMNAAVIKIAISLSKDFTEKSLFFIVSDFLSLELNLLLIFFTQKKKTI